MEQFTKADLIAKCRALGLPTGDTARNPKEHYKRLLTGAVGEAAPASPPAGAPAEPAAQLAAAVAAIAAAVTPPAAALDEERVRAIAAEEVAKAAPRPHVTEIVLPTGERRQLPGRQHPAFERVLKLASIRQNILLVGPAGCGKTHLAGQVAEALGLTYAAISCTAGLSESALTGWLLPVGDAGRFEYVTSPFVRAYEHGGLVLLDEIDAADPNVLLIINAALANGRMTIPHRVGSPTVKRHPDFVCIAAANTYGHGADRVYAGRAQLDGALLDRFRAGVVTLDYDAELEKQAAPEELIKWAHAVRATVSELGLRRVMSTRFILDAARQLEAGASTLAEVKAAYLADWPAADRGRLGALAK